MSYFYRYNTFFIVFIPRPVTTSFNWFIAVPVHGSDILKLSGTGSVRGPSKKGNRTETGPDFKALPKTSLPMLLLETSDVPKNFCLHLTGNFRVVAPNW